MYASDEVILSMITFIGIPSYKNYTTAVYDMRKDLWGKATGITLDILTAFAQGFDNATNDDG